MINIYYSSKRQFKYPVQPCSPSLIQGNRTPPIKAQWGWWGWSGYFHRSSWSCSLQQQRVPGLTGVPGWGTSVHTQNNQKVGKESQHECPCSPHKGCGENSSIPAHPGPPQGCAGADRTAPFIKSNSVCSQRGFGAGRETFVAKFQWRRFCAEEESLVLTLFLFEIPELFSDVPFGKLKEGS